MFFTATTSFNSVATLFPPRRERSEEDFHPSEHEKSTILVCASMLEWYPLQVQETPDPILWSAILSNLNVLRIVSQQHQEDGPYYDHGVHQYCKED
jgi:hypothetical protein